jgi:hypothetical protein
MNPVQGLRKTKMCRAKTYAKLLIGTGIIAITSLYAVGASIHGTAQIHYTRFPGEGGDWLKWNENEREIFVAGYVTGLAALATFSIYIDSLVSQPFNLCCKISYHRGSPR